MPANVPFIKLANKKYMRCKRTDPAFSVEPKFAKTLAPKGSMGREMRSIKAAAQVTLLQVFCI